MDEEEMSLLSEPGTQSKRRSGLLLVGDETSLGLSDYAARLKNAPSCGAFYAADATATRCLDVTFGAHAAPRFPIDGNGNGTTTDDTLHRALQDGSATFAAARADHPDVGTAGPFRNVVIADITRAFASSSSSSNVTNATATTTTTDRSAILLLRLPRVLPPGTGRRMSNDSITLEA